MDAGTLIESTTYSGMCVFNLEARNREAERVIGTYALHHAAADISIGIAGLFIPGGGIWAMLTSMAAQAPLIYQPMARDLAKIYNASPDEVTDNMVLDMVTLGTAADVASEVGSELMKELASELLQEMGVGAAVGFLPVLGGLLAAGVDAAVAATLTWRVGTMISAYHQNGNEWIRSRRVTYERAKSLVGIHSPKPTGRVNLDKIPQLNPEVRSSQIAFIKNLVDLMSVMPVDQIRTALLNKSVPVDLINAVLTSIA